MWRGPQPLISPASEVRTELSESGTCSGGKGDRSVRIKHRLKRRNLEIKVRKIQTAIDALSS